jgi:hypothetical protein
MRNHKSNDLCTRRHIYREHRHVKDRPWSNCWAVTKYGLLICLCAKFKLDNLSYLEKEYKKKQGVS